jgi:hypothetical protein
VGASRLAGAGWRARRSSPARQSRGSCRSPAMWRNLRSSRRRRRVRLNGADARCVDSLSALCVGSADLPISRCGVLRLRSETQGPPAAGIRCGLLGTGTVVVEFAASRAGRRQIESGVTPDDDVQRRSPGPCAFSTARSVVLGAGRRTIWARRARRRRLPPHPPARPRCCPRGQCGG